MSELASESSVQRSPTHPVVETSSGRVRGGVGGGVAHYLGIPYAAAPIGALRFGAPAPVLPWSGVRDALVHGPTAPAPRMPPPLAPLLPEVSIPGDEFLNLSIWAPAQGVDRPVIVWIHGGAFVNGASSAPSYDGTAFARDGVVLVAINYRLGVEGFLELPDAVSNRGLLDQVAALSWVRENIAAFGGDPGNVTVAGESAGAFSVAALMAMPSARGLFGRAILQSGAGSGAYSPATAALVADRVAEALGVAPTAAGLSALSPEHIATGLRTVLADVDRRPDPGRWGEVALTALAFAPVIDGDVLPESPIEAVRGGSAAHLDVLHGWNRHEHRFFLVPSGVADMADDGMLIGAAAARGLSGNAVDSYRRATPDASPGLVMADILGDWFFRVPAIRLAEAHQRSHVYEFDWETPVLDGRLGACHALEIEFVFDTLPAGRPLNGGSAPQDLADTMHAAWVAFATDGEPGWEPYGHRRLLRRFGDVVETVTEPRSDLRELWEGVL